MRLFKEKLAGEYQPVYRDVPRQVLRAVDQMSIVEMKNHPRPARLMEGVSATANSGRL